MEKILTEDIVGAATRKTYGKAGDVVTVIKVDGNMALVKGKDELYHVRVEKLTDKTKDHGH